MKTNAEFLAYLDLETSEIPQISDVEIDKLERALHLRRMQLMAEKLNRAGFHTRISRTSDNVPEFFGYLLVFSPDQSIDRESYSIFADLAECQRLLDTVKNLPPQAAYDRWQAKVKGWEEEPYTVADARRDAAKEIESGKKLYLKGVFNSEDLSFVHKFAHELIIDTQRAAALLGQKGGRSTSEAKITAARANGKKGGRPRKN